MPRSHPPTLITLARAALREHDLVPRGAVVLVAVSGGPDSMALLHVLAGLRARLAFGLFAHGVDHGLRPESAGELDVVDDFARALGVPFGRTRVSVAAGGNVQARARAARWHALEEAARRIGATRIATGHHADDRAETVLIRLLRGTGAAGLGVLPARDGPRVRPFIRARRVDIEAHIARHQVPFVIDPSNANMRFLRARVRADALPLLERLSPSIVEHLCRVADDLWTLRGSRTHVFAARASDADLAEAALRDPAPSAAPPAPTGGRGGRNRGARAKKVHLSND